MGEVTPLPHDNEEYWGKQLEIAERKYITEDFIFRMTPDEMDAVALNEEKETANYTFIQEIKQRNLQEH